MAMAPTYPGVYLREIPSGERTIVGVSTSLTAFVGKAKRGPVNRAVHIFGFADFERRFGGLSQDSELSYAVRQFFLNGGSEALIVRVARNPSPAVATLVNEAGSDVLDVSARDQGTSGNDISVRIDYRTGAPESTFNLTVIYEPADNPMSGSVEEFFNLSMNSADPRYVVDVVNQSSRLVALERSSDLSGFAGQGHSTSGDLADADLSTIIDDSHNVLHLAVDGEPPAAVTLVPPLGGYTEIDSLDELSDSINAGIESIPATARPNVAAHVDGTRIVLESKTEGERSSVRVLPGSRDASARLKLGTTNGGNEVDAVAEFRPAPSQSGTLTGGALSPPVSVSGSFRIGIDDSQPVEVTLSGVSGDSEEIATAIQEAVRRLRPAFRDFQCESNNEDRLVLTSGRAGKGSSVVVQAAPTNDIAATLRLLPAQGAVAELGADTPLRDGNEFSFTSDQAFGVYIGDRSRREGIYALEAVQRFNILCLPGVSDAGILSEAVAYGAERQAFTLVDPKPNQTPEEMQLTALGTELPKLDHAAVYYPWVQVADPLRNGRPRTCPPSGTIAGLYARTDATRGVWKAPAGTDATLAGVQGLDYPLSDPENGALNPLGVNCLRVFPVFGAVSWGARTLRGADQMASEYKYVPVRRLALFIQQSLYSGTQWAVFEPNDEPLWAQLRQSIGAFMRNLFRQGAFQGKSPTEAYFVQCDGETTTQNDINLGIVNIVVGFAPLKPAEFVIIKLQQLAGQVAV